MSDIRIKSAFISVFYKEGLEAIVKKLDSLGVTIVSTGGSYDYITGAGVKATKVEELNHLSIHPRRQGQDTSPRRFRRHPCKKGQ